MTGLMLGLKLLRARKWRFVRQAVAATWFVAFISFLVVINSSFNFAFRDAQRVNDENGGQGYVIVDRTGIRLAAYNDTWLWSADTATLNNYTLHIMSYLRDGFLAVTYSVMGVMTVREVMDMYARAKRENEEQRTTVGVIYTALGVRPASIYLALMVETLVSLAVGMLAGVLITALVIVPGVMSVVGPTIAGLFFRRFDYAYGAVAAGIFVGINLSIKSWAQSLAVSHERLLDAAREVT